MSNKRLLETSPLHKLDHVDRCSAWYSIAVLVADGHDFEEALGEVEYDYGYRNDPDGPRMFAFDTPGV
jgi:hypothetical protein